MGQSQYNTLSCLARPRVDAPMTCVFFLMLACFDAPDQRCMIETISRLTKMRFGEQEHNRAKDTKEVSKRTSGMLAPCCGLTCDCPFQPAGGIYSRLEAQFKSQNKQSSDKIPRYL